MSFYRDNIIKKDDLKRSKAPVHIGDTMYAQENEYIEKTLKEKRDEIIQEMDALRNKKLQEINSEVESIRKEAYEAGREQAMEEAMEKVKEESAAKLKEVYDAEMERAKSKYLEANHYSITQKKTIEEKKKYWFKDNEEQIVDILMSTVEKIIGKAMEMEAQDVKSIISESLNEVSDRSKKLWVRVSPKSKQALEENKYEDRDIEFLADPALSELDVMIETADGEWVDSTVKNKLNKVKNILKEWVESNEPLR